MCCPPVVFRFPPPIDAFTKQSSRRQVALCRHHLTFGIAGKRFVKYFKLGSPYALANRSGSLSFTRLTATRIRGRHLDRINSSAADNPWGVFSKSSIRLRENPYAPTLRIPSTLQARPSQRTLRQVNQLRQALKSIKAARLKSVIEPGQVEGIAYATAVSATSLNLGSNTPAAVSSVEEINTAPTSLTQFGPNWNGSTATAPWSGPGSTADATVGGTYDGSNGNGTLTFRVYREGTHGVDDFRIKVYAPDGSFIENIDIDENDPVETVYTLSNGLNITLSAGDLVKDEEFSVNTDLLTTSYGPSAPAWTGSTAAATIAGTYNGAQGTGTLTFRVTREGVHGEDDLTVKVYAPEDTYIEQIDIKNNDAIDKVYSLSSGLTFTLDAGELVKGETLAVSVDASDPAATNPSQPAWQ